MSNNTIESRQAGLENDIFAKEIKLFSEEQKELQSDIEQHIAGRKDVHKAFINNIEKTLSEESKTAINTLFGGKNLKEGIDNFLLERRKVEELNQKGDSGPLANHEFSLFLRGDPETNTILKEYYKDFTDLKAGKKKKEDLLTKYDINKKTKEEIEELKKARAPENAKKEDTPLDKTSAGVISQYQEEEEVPKIPKAELAIKEKKYKDNASNLISKLRKRLGVRYKHDTNPNNGLDCSGLIYAGLKELGLKNGMPRVSGDMYRKSLDHNIKQGGFNSDDELKEYEAKIKPGHLVFWQSTTKKSAFNAHGNHVHHVAIVSDPPFKNGELNVIESTGSKGVREGNIKIDRIRNKSKHLSKIFICENPSLI